jgi:hypothetical protein
MTSVHEEEAHHHVLRPFVIIQAIIQYDERPRVNGRLLIHILFFFDLL